MDTAAINNMDKVTRPFVLILYNLHVFLQDMLKLQIQLLTAQLQIERKPTSENIKE